MKIIFLLLDGVSYKDSWLVKNNMPCLETLTLDALNFHNHYSVTHNTAGNVSCLLSGLTSSLTGIMGQKQNFRDNNYGYIQSLLKKNDINTYFYSTCNTGKLHVKGDPFDFNEFKIYGPSLAEYKVLSKNINLKYLNTIKKLDPLNNYLVFFHYIDTHAPFETPLNQINKKDFPEIHKFLFTFENIFYRIPRRFLRKYIKPNTLLRNFYIYKEYPELKELNPIPLGPVLSAERFKDFYNMCWQNEKLYNEYDKMRDLAARYLDQNLNFFINKVKDINSRDTIFFISSDHGNNDLIKPEYTKSIGLLNNLNTHVPMSVITFDESLKKKLNIHGDIKEFTSHTDFYNTVESIFNLQKTENKFEKNLLRTNKVDRYIFSELHDTRFEYGHTKMFNDKKVVDLKFKTTNKLKEFKIFNKENLIDVSQINMFNDYYSYKSKYNSYYDETRLFKQNFLN